MKNKKLSSIVSVGSGMGKTPSDASFLIGMVLRFQSSLRPGTRMLPPFSPLPSRREKNASP